MLATVPSSTIVGINPLDIDVEVDVSSGLPSFEIVGLPGTAVREARDRVRTALKNAGFRMPPGRVTVNLAPAHLPKAGTLFDLPIALGILIAGGMFTPKLPLNRLIVVGELSLDGSLRPIRGALCIAAPLRKSDRILVLPGANLNEVQAIPSVRTVGLYSLRDLKHLGTDALPVQMSRRTFNPGSVIPRDLEDCWDEIKGQRSAKRALEIAVAGRHHTLMIGPPGAGKTALAKALTALAPPLSAEESIEVSQVYSVAGLLKEDDPFVTTPPFRAPHHTVTPVGLLGGGATLQPGEVSLAHRGVLFLDELPEFHIQALEGLRQPLEDGAVVISRAAGRASFPAGFLLVAAANPCPCGYFGDPHHSCMCSEAALARYRRRLSGPILDRIDLQVWVKRPSIDALITTATDDEPIRQVRQRIHTARSIQHRRFGPLTITNANMTPQHIREHVALDNSGQTLLREAVSRWSLSPRAIHKVLRVARTIADLNLRERVHVDDVAEALSYRTTLYTIKASQRGMKPLKKVQR